MQIFSSLQCSALVKALDLFFFIFLSFEFTLVTCKRGTAKKKKRLSFKTMAIACSESLQSLHYLFLDFLPNSCW